MTKDQLRRFGLHVSPVEEADQVDEQRQKNKLVTVNPHGDEVPAHASSRYVQPGTLVPVPIDEIHRMTKGQLHDFLVQRRVTASMQVQKKILKDRILKMYYSHSDADVKVNNDAD